MTLKIHKRPKINYKETQKMSEKNTLSNLYDTKMMRKQSWRDKKEQQGHKKTKAYRDPKQPQSDHKDTKLQK